MKLTFKNHGTEHWWHQRLTAIANIPLVLWLVWNIVHLAGADYAVVMDWLRNPVNAVLLNFTIFSAFYHAALGLQVIIEDYCADEKFRKLKILGARMFLFVGAAICFASVIKIVFFSVP